MKAIKLASIFAVTAVAAAVSTTTMAAEPVFWGEAGLVYDLTDDAESWDSEGEVNIIFDTGVIYVDIDMASGSFVIDEAYVKQGAVSFGDFDGSISVDAQYTAGVWQEGEYSIADNTDLGIQYDTGAGLVVALEMEEGKDGVGFAASYETSVDAFTVGFSAGTYTSEDDTTDGTTMSVGVSADLGMATAIASYSTGEDGGADFSSMVLGADAALSEAFAVSLQFSSDFENELDNTELTAYYTVGDVTYWATNQSGDSEATLVGAYANF